MSVRPPSSEGHRPIQPKKEVNVSRELIEGSDNVAEAVTPIFAAFRRLQPGEGKPFEAARSGGKGAKQVSKMLTQRFEGKLPFKTK